MQSKEIDFFLYGLEAVLSLQEGTLEQLAAIDLPSPVGARVTSVAVHSDKVVVLWSQGTVMTYAPTVQKVDWHQQMSRRLAGSRLLHPSKH